MMVTFPGDSTLVDPNRWQPLALTMFIDQNGNPLPGTTPKFLTPAWGSVTPCAMLPGDRTIHNRGGFDYPVYMDPGPPPMLDTLDTASPGSQLCKWAFELVAVWSSHLKAADTQMLDISPASLGNNATLPAPPEAFPAFCNLTGGGDAGTGRPLNPRTGLPYTPQVVPRGDFTRVLAEFWADGPTSETPPGHWFTILNDVSGHPLFTKRFRGQGPVLDDLQWDVKSYFALGGAVHAAAISAWGIKGWYDFVRPISAIRWMAGKGQCNDTTLASYSPMGIPLLPGYISNPATGVADVGWILAANWFPYQRPTFVTPPFAGYISGHSTYSRAAAEVMTSLTGDEYFPGGMAKFHATNHQFLVFEDGPSVDVTLQWATYRDASDQCSLSRIWGGIHLPIDDIPGRLIGCNIGVRAFTHAWSYLESGTLAVPMHASQPAAPAMAVYPNPARTTGHVTVTVDAAMAAAPVELFDVMGHRFAQGKLVANGAQTRFAIDTGALRPGVYFVRSGRGVSATTRRLLVVR